MQGTVQGLCIISFCHLCGPTVQRKTERMCVCVCVCVCVFLCLCVCLCSWEDYGSTGLSSPFARWPLLSLLTGCSPSRTRVHFPTQECTSFLREISLSFNSFSCLSMQALKMMNQTDFEISLVGGVSTHRGFSWFPELYSLFIELFFKLGWVWVWRENVRTFFQSLKKINPLPFIEIVYEIVRWSVGTQMVRRCVKQDQTTTFSFSPATVWCLPPSLFGDLIVFWLICFKPNFEWFHHVEFGAVNSTTGVQLDFFILHRTFCYFWR